MDLVEFPGFRKAVADALTAGDVKAADYIGETLTPPCAAVVPADPYLTPAQPGDDLPYGFTAVALDVLLVSGLTTAKKQADAMDELIAKALTALDAFDVRSVTRPGVIKLRGANYLASTIRVEEATKL